MAAKSSERGVALVEFSIILPFFVLLFYICADISFFISNYLSLVHVAREGARMAAFTNSPEENTSITRRMQTLAASESGLSPFEARATCDDTNIPGTGAVNFVTVTVSGSYTPLFSQIWLKDGAAARLPFRVSQRAPHLLPKCKA